MLLFAQATAGDGVILGRMAFDGGSDGRPVGAAQSELVTPVGEKYTVTLPPAGAALLTVVPEYVDRVQSAPIF